MKRIIWTGALALTVMACLTACGDDDSGTSAGGDDDLYTCDITAKKVVVKQNAGPYSVTMTYTHNEDGSMTTRYEYGTGHNNVCDGPMPTEVDEDDAEMTCKDNVLTVKTKEAVTTEEFQEYAGAATKACPEPASWGKDTKPSDDDDEAGTDDDGEDSTDEDEGGEESGDDGDEGGEAASASCNFEKSDDTWVIANGEGGGEMTIKWKDGKAVTVTKSEQADEELCELTLEIFSSDPTGTGTYSCDGKYLVIEDPDTYANLSRNDLYKMYCGS